MSQNLTHADVQFGQPSLTLEYQGKSTARFGDLNDEYHCNGPDSVKSQELSILGKRLSKAKVVKDPINAIPDLGALIAQKKNTFKVRNP